MATLTKSAPQATPAPAFEYRRLPELGAARARLAELRAERESRGERGSALREAVEAAQTNLLRLQTDHRLGRAPLGEVQAAATTHEKARAALATYSPMTSGVRDEIKRVAEMVETLERQERELNLGPFKAARRELVRELVGRLRVAAVVNEQLRALDVAGGNLAAGLPGAWDELTVVNYPGSPVHQTSQLESYEKVCRAAGQLD